MKMIVTTLIVILYSGLSSAARSYDSINIPGAVCGDGSPYKVFVESRSNSKLAIKLQGGGACWSYFTCFTLGTTRGSIPERLTETQGFSSDQKRFSPVADYSYVFFPYCTGDVHLGNHQASYGEEAYNHSGRHNVKTAIDFLVARRHIEPRNVNDFVLYGDSAGALGALYHVGTIGRYFTKAQKKTVVADAPGLHFGNSFWRTFTKELFFDYSTALGELGYDLDRDRGNIAAVVPLQCQNFSQWNFGILQATRDRTMSWVFGKISSDDHEAAVLGSEGVYALTQSPNDNCSSFTPSSKAHRLLNKNDKLDIIAGGKTSLNYTYELIEQGATYSYR